ncbi:MAG TPA: hypothetical protein VGB66_04065 [Longimicrobium sp.]
MNTKALSFAALTLALAAGSGEAAAQTQTVTFEVAPINEMSVTGSPSLTINSAVAGSGPTNATASGSWAITTHEMNRKVTASIDEAMPAGVTLSVALAAPTGASSAGTVALGTSAADVVTGITTLSESGLAVTYTLQASAAAGVVPEGQRTVTYTVVAGS